MAAVRVPPSACSTSQSILICRSPKPFRLVTVIDCDVLQADGGTRTAAITGSYVALYLCFRHMKKLGAVNEIPLTDQVAAVSCGIHQQQAVLDLDYAEDSAAEADANFVLTAKGGIIEVQGTAERAPFSEAEFMQLLAYARKGVTELTHLQRTVLGLA